MNLFNTLAYCNGVITGGIPDGIGNIVHLVVKAIQVAVPILLIIWGMLDFAKAIIGQKEDDIKAGQKIFIKRLIAAVVVFLVVTIVQLVINLADSIDGTSNEASTAWDCASELLNGKG